jgi:hypothetical protein
MTATLFAPAVVAVDRHLQHAAGDLSREAFAQDLSDD